MKNLIQQLIQESLETLRSKSILPAEPSPNFTVERCKDPSHGDLATNVALVHAKQAKLAPRQLAEKIVSELPVHEQIINIQIAGPGFINFKLSGSTQTDIVRHILAEADNFGRIINPKPQRIHIEFVSANPTGPLHVGHGRGAAFGSSLANILEFSGHSVDREYYINDAGRQMDILALSVWLRYLAQIGVTVPFPSNGYQGDYVVEIALILHQQFADRFTRTALDIQHQITADETSAAAGDKESHVDDLIRNAKKLLGDDYAIVFDAGLNHILDDIRADLAEFGVIYERWFSERELAEQGAVDRCIQSLKQSDDLTEKEGAWWFRSSHYGDEKDRVVVRDNGQPTYFASDLAYHKDKSTRQFDRLINVWGSDHHGYIARVRAGMQAMQLDPNALVIKLVQFAILYRGQEKVPMSTRAGQFVTLRQLREEVGTDAARFFYCLRSPEQHMDFDLDLAKSQSNDNPVYYVQYAYARICSVMQQLHAKGLEWQPGIGLAHLDKLIESHELALLKRLAQFTEVLAHSSQNLEVHPIANYLRQLAGDLHAYYNAHTFIIDDEALCQARLCLIQATRQILKNGLTLLSVSQPESM